MESLSVGELAKWAPRLPEVLTRLGIPLIGNEEASLAYLCEDAGIPVEDVLAALEGRRPAVAPRMVVDSLEIVGGTDKDGAPEPVASLTLQPGQSLALVGVTGSGKSQLLADVESLAQGDSRSGRTILVNGTPPPEDLRWSVETRPVAQIFQSMRFLLDVAVAEFIDMHASIRGLEPSEKLRQRVIEVACSLCGERFRAESPLTELSGGQSRALMIADAALVNQAPVVAIDEIENAGIDRRRALSFLSGHGTITLLATHDPYLALTADHRVVIGNGAMRMVLARSDEESAALGWLEQRERTMVDLRSALRGGRRLECP